MLHLVQQAVNPKLGLAECLEHWAAIAFDLREPRRRRGLQADQLEENCAILS
jgi:hypothetical protein